MAGVWLIINGTHTHIEHRTTLSFGRHGTGFVRFRVVRFLRIGNGLWFVPVQKLTESRHGTNQSPPSSDSCEAQHTHVLAARQVLVMAQEATTDAYSVAIPTVLHAPSGVPRTLTPPLPHPPPSIPTQEEGRGVSNRDNESWCEGAENQGGGAHLVQVDP